MTVGARMRIKYQIIYIVVVAACCPLPAQQSFTQDGFVPPAEQPTHRSNPATNASPPSYSSQVDAQSSYLQSSQQNHELKQTTPRRLTNPNSILNNELRGTSDDGMASVVDPAKPHDVHRGLQRYDAQPLPPKPAVFSRDSGIQQLAHTQNFTPGNQNGSAQSLPLEELNPSHMLKGVPKSNQFNHTGSGSSIPILGDIPVVQSQTQPQSKLSSRIPTNVADSSRVVTSSFTNQQQHLPSNSVSKPAKHILARYEVSASQQALPGIPVDLESLMKSTPVRYRMAMVQQYWETFFDWSTLINRRMHAGWLSQLPNPRSQTDQTLLQTAKSMARNEIMAAEIQLSRSQSKLQQLAKTNHPQLLPLPMDQPLVTKYNTHYEWYANRNMIPAKLKGINEMLPRTHQLIASRSATVQQAESARNQAVQAYSSGQIQLGGLLEAGRVWQTSMQGLIGTVVSYNQAISDYALTITPAQKPIGQIVSMLVAKPKSINEVAQRNSILNRQTNSNQNRFGQNIAAQNAGLSGQPDNTAQAQRLPQLPRFAQQEPAINHGNRQQRSANQQSQQAVPTQPLRNNNLGGTGRPQGNQVQSQSQGAWQFQNPAQSGSARQFPRNNGNNSTGNQFGGGGNFGG